MQLNFQWLLIIERLTSKQIFGHYETYQTNKNKEPMNTYYKKH